MIFKVNIGAYRYNASLTFNELRDLGSIESTVVNEITFSYLTPFETLKMAEQARTKVADRGIKDAWITIFHNSGKITPADFIRLSQ